MKNQSDQHRTINTPTILSYKKELSSCFLLLLLFYYYVLIAQTSTIAVLIVVKLAAPKQSLPARSERWLPWAGPAVWRGAWCSRQWSVSPPHWRPSTAPTPWCWEGGCPLCSGPAHKQTSCHMNIIWGTTGLKQWLHHLFTFCQNECTIERRTIPKCFQFILMYTKLRKKSQQWSEDSISVFSKGMLKAFLCWLFSPIMKYSPTKTCWQCGQRVLCQRKSLVPAEHVTASCDATLLPWRLCVAALLSWKPLL